MKSSTFLAVGAVIALITAVAMALASPTMASPTMLIAVTGVVCVVVAAAVLGPSACPRESSGPNAEHAWLPAVGVGTVRDILKPSCVGAGGRLITIDVKGVGGETFIGRLRCRAGDPLVSMLHPGLPVLVAFDPATREQLSLADDMVAVRAAFDRMLIGKGLMTSEELDLIRRGTKGRGIVTAMRTTGAVREDYREVELDLMVSRPEGGQFPAHETALIHQTSLTKVSPGSVIDTYYRPGDESTVAVCVPPG